MFNIDDNFFRSTVVNNELVQSVMVRELVVMQE